MQRSQHAIPPTLRSNAASVIGRLKQLALQTGLNVIYVLFLLLGSPWMLWRVCVGKNRRGWGQKLWGSAPPSAPARSTGRCLWLHAVSVGEVNLLETVIEVLVDRHPDLHIAISTTTETGFDLATKKYPDHEVFFCPFDFSWAIANVLKRLQPQAVILAELELWPNLILTCHRQRVPVAVINGRLGESSFRGYQRFRWLTKPLMQQLTGVAAQNETYADRFRRLGCQPSTVVVTGSVKFDGAKQLSGNLETNAVTVKAGVEQDDFVLVAGSTQLQEDLIAGEVFQSLIGTHPQLKLVLVPRHPERCATLQRRLSEMNIESTRWTQLQSGDRPQVLIIDTIGELGHWWGRANVAYVGGSMGKREGQNMIEPAALGIATSFGPRTKNFRDVVQQLLAQQAAVVVRDDCELKEFVVQAIRDPEQARQMGARARQIVQQNVGASLRTVEWLDQRLLTGKSAARSKSGLSAEAKVDV